MSLEVQKSYDDEYNLYKIVELDSPPIKKNEEVVKNFIMYRIIHACIES